MYKLRVILKLATLSILLLPFLFFFGATFLLFCHAGLKLNNGISPSSVSSIYTVLIFLYYVFPVTCVIYFLKVVRVKTSEASPRIGWMILPFFIFLPLLAILSLCFSGQGGSFSHQIQEQARAQVTGHLVASYTSPWRDTSLKAAPSKSYLHTCTACYTLQNTLHCTCQTNEGMYNKTELNLATIKNKGLQIQNCNGQLTADIEKCP